jgi:UDP-N-acetylglucosamine:LPS N-acetylglucosamine transferase
MADNIKSLKVCVVASAGGHIMQLLKLSDSWRSYETSYVSTTKVVTRKLQQYGRAYIVGECNREHLFKSLIVLIRCVAVVLKERPDVVISTGAAPGFLLCITAKIFGAKIVWVDSIANTERLSMSGRIIRPFSSVFLTQWPELVDKSKNVEHVGAVI